MTPDINKILRAHPRSSRYGAPMGRPDERPDDGDELYLQRVRFVDGDYSPDGTYWGGGGEPLWAAFKPDLSALVFVRAPSRGLAAEFVLEQYPEVTIHGVPRPIAYLGYTIRPVLGSPRRWQVQVGDESISSLSLARVKAFVRRVTA